MPTTTPTPVAAWNFNKDLGESAGQYKDSIGGLILASGDGQDHPAAAAKVGAGAYAGANSADTLLTLSGASGVSFTNGGTVAIWVRAAAVAAVLDYVLELIDIEGNKLQLRLQISTTLGRRFGMQINTNTPVYEAYVAADTNWHLAVISVSAPYPADPGDPDSPLIQAATLYIDDVSRAQTGGVGVLDTIRVAGGAAGNYFAGDLDSLTFWDHAISAEQRGLVWADGAGWEYSTQQTIKQHMIVGPGGIIQPVGACSVVPGWV